MKTLQENDILVCSGGYECTRVTFFKVTKVINGFAVVKTLKSNRVSFEPFAGTNGSGEVVPTDEFTSEDTIRRKIRYNHFSGDAYIRIAEYESAYLWDGKPQFFDFRNI